MTYKQFLFTNLYIQSKFYEFNEDNNISLYENCLECYKEFEKTIKEGYDLIPQIKTFLDEEVDEGGLYKR